MVVISMYAIVEISILTMYILVILSTPFHILYILMYVILLIISNVYFTVKLYRISSSLKGMTCTISKSYKALQLDKVSHDQILYDFPMFMFKEIQDRFIFHDVLDNLDIGQTFTLKHYHKTYALIQDHFDHLYLTYTENLERF